MYKTFLVSSTAALCLMGCSKTGSETDDLGETALVTSGYKQNALCVSGDNSLCNTLPADLTELKVAGDGYTPDSNIVPPSNSVQQSNFDYFAWQMFVALNWPAGSNGQPSGSSTITSNVTSPRVWESYKTISQVYPQGSPATSCASDEGRLVLTQTSKLTSSSFIEPFTPYPLIDTDGNFIMYDIRLNDIEANYISGQGLSTKAGQTTFKNAGKKWDFPRGLGSTPGAMELKTAWRVFPKGTKNKVFFTVPGTIEIPAGNSATGKALCLDVELGLVGMHIMQKITTPSNFSDFWVWGTFEHVANVPDAQGALPSGINDKAKSSNAQSVPSSCPVPTNPAGNYSFFDAKCTDDGKSCTPNAPPQTTTKTPKGRLLYLWQDQPPYAKTYLMDGQYGTQVTRCWEVYDSAKQINQKFQAALAGSVWGNYQLVGAQWAQGTTDGPPSIIPFSAPYYLTNSTLETYLQVNEILMPNQHVPNDYAPGSCIACHNMATDSVGNKSDFSFLAGYAQ